MNKTKRIAFGIGMALAVLAAFTASAAADYNIYHLVPQDGNCTGAGCNVTVSVMLNTSLNNITGGQYSIDFDPSVVNITGAVKGDDWPAGFNFWHEGDYVFMNFIDFWNTYGPGDLEIAKMTVQCEAPGISPLEFNDHPPDDNVRVLTSGGYVPHTVENGTFTCTGPSETFTKSLAKGWNLISLPLTNATDMTVANIIDASLSGSYDALYKYDASAHNFVPLSSSDTMENGVGYFIHMTSADTWTYTGMAYKQMNVSLEPGLNMIGWLNCSENISDALSYIDGEYWYATTFNASEQKYTDTFNPVAPDVFNRLTKMEPGVGYFISAKQGGWLNVSC